MIGRMSPMLEILANQNNSTIYLYSATKKTATYKKSNGWEFEVGSNNLSRSITNSILDICDENRKSMWTMIK